MGLFPFYSQTDMASDALFRAYGKNISDGLQAVGLIKTADSGQINWATVNRPGSTSTWAGSEFYRMNDSLQSLYPSFIQIKYGTSTTAVNLFAISITLGKATTGSGALSGSVTNELRIQCYSNTANQTFLNFVSGDADRFVIGGFVQAGVDRCFMAAVSRTRNSDGSANNYGVNMFGISHGQSGQQLMCNSVLDKYPSSLWTTIAAIAPNNAQSGSYAGELGVYPIRPVRGYLDYPDLNGVILTAGTLGHGQVFNSTILGASRKYIVIGNNANENWHANLSSSGLFCGRYE